MATDIFANNVKMLVPVGVSNKMGKPEGTFE